MTPILAADRKSAGERRILMSAACAGNLPQGMTPALFTMLIQHYHGDRVNVCLVAPVPHQVKSYWRLVGSRIRVMRIPGSWAGRVTDCDRRWVRLAEVVALLAGVGVKKERMAPPSMGIMAPVM